MDILEEHLNEPVAVCPVCGHLEPVNKEKQIKQHSQPVSIKTFKDLASVSWCEGTGFIVEQTTTRKQLSYKKRSL